MSIPLSVLIVEDSEDDAQLLLRELARGGYSVTSERVDSPDAMRVAINRQAWDVVVCDYSMPHFSGLDALRILRERTQDTPFIFLSGTIGEDTAVAALKQGAQDYVMKGNFKRLLPSVKRELEDAQHRKERTHLEQRIRHLEKFEAIGKLAGGIAHDFNNVLAVILVTAELGEELAAKNPALRERFLTIRSQSELGANLTRQLLAFARRQVLKPEKIDINVAITEMNKMLESALGANIEFRQHLSPAIGTIEADPGQIDQVIMNLCLNARDAMPQGGTLVLETTNVDLDEEFLKAHSYGRSGSYVMLTVSDTGVGMDAATQEHIFEPFFTTKELGRGTGLGLATVYGVVRQHGGFIHVYSDVGKGTTFRVYFPAFPGEPEPKVNDLPSTVSTGTETILIAEDNEALLELANEILSARGYKVILAKDGAEALRLFRENAETVDLVLLDVVMPKLSGPEAFTEMKALRPNLVGVFTTGHTAETASLNSKLVAGAAFLQKPYLPRALAQSVRAALDRNKMN